MVSSFLFDVSFLAEALRSAKTPRGLQFAA
jgi:hypothetical protein